jgi:tetratricopeptide (TPR) repeat protein
MALEIKSAKDGEGMTAQQLYDQAEKHVQEDRLEEAEDIFSWLLEHDMNNVYCLFGMANCLMKRGRNIAALHILERCVAINPKFAEGWNNLGYLYQHENMKERSAECFAKALEIHPEQASFWNNMGTVYVNAGAPEKAIPYCDKAIEIDPDNVDAHWNKSLALLELREWDKGFDEYEWGLHDEGKRKKRTYAKEGENIPRWEGTAGKSVVVYGEQGVGDEIMFASCLPELMRDCKEVVYDAHPRLQPIMRLAYPDLTVYGTRKQTELYWPGFHQIDAHVAIGSLPRLYRRSEEAFPRTAYLKPDETLVEEYKRLLAELGPGLNIGVSWKGGTKTTRHDLRSLPLDKWLPIFGAVEGANWISMQYHDNAAGIIDLFEQDHGVKLHHWQRDIDDLYQNYCGLMPALDLIVTVCTSAVHAAGAMGVPCWCLTPSQPAWRYAVKGPMPWYESVKMYRQKGEDWGAVVERVARDLSKWAAKKEAA